VNLKKLKEGNLPISIRAYDCIGAGGTITGVCFGVFSHVIAWSMYGFDMSSIELSE